MIRAYNARTADSVWRSAWFDVVAAESSRTNAVKGDSREILHVAFGIDDPRQRFVYSRIPGINPAFAIAEVVWIVRGRRDAAFLQPWNEQLKRFTGDSAELHGAYGHRLRNHLGFDQLHRAANALRNNPTQRQVVLQVWDSTVDAPDSYGAPKSADIPCNVFALLKISDGQLEWLQVMRSNDLLLGMPYNIFQWTTLQEVMAGWLGLGLGTYNQVSDSLHVYDRDVGKYDVSASRDCPLNPDDLRLLPDESTRVFTALEASIEAMALAREPDALYRAFGEVDVPAPYTDLLRVMAVERLRRIGAETESVLCAEDIKNPALKELARAWNFRFKDEK